MKDESSVPAFRPTTAWWEDWPHSVSTSVQVMASVSGAAAATAVQEFLKQLRQDPKAETPGGSELYYRGGFTAAVTSPVDGRAWKIGLASAGEDGFESVESGAELLVSALQATSGTTVLRWHELPATRVDPVQDDELSL